MKILIFGAGALGSFVGGSLSKHHSVTLVSRKIHADTINSKGLLIEGKTNYKAKLKALEAIPDEIFDLVLVTVKSYDTADAAKEMSAKLERNTSILSLQNGIGNVEEISRSFKKVIGGTTSHGVTFVEPGRIYHAGLGETRLGNFKGVTDEELDELCKAFTVSGIETQRSDRILSEIWAKAIVNTSINPLTAITGLTNGFLLSEKHLEAIMVSACSEAVEVARSCGIELPPYDMIENAKEVARITAENRSSMLQDIERGKRTEIDSITGVFVDKGKECGIPTPTNSLLFGLVKGIEDASRRG